MSWWVTDYIAVSENETQQLCNIQSDAVSDLPAQDQTSTAGFIFVRGSRAYVLDTSGQYIMNSSGQWILQKSGQEIEISADDIVYDNTSSGMTATNVQDAIDEIHTLDDMQDRALAELYGENANQQLEINYAINTGAKNLLENIRTTTTTRGITFTVNEDGSVTANGTNDGTGASVLNINTQSTLALDNGEYILSGCPAGGSETGYMMDITRSPGSSLKDIGNGISFRVGGDYTVNEFRIVISRNITVNNLTFYPMIRLAEITNSTFEPYAPTNRELYETKLSAEDVWGQGQSIPDNANLNDYTTGGKYYGPNSAGASVSNLPVANSNFNFSLEVKNASPVHTLQYLTILRSADDPYIYSRRYYNGSWGSWYRFTGETVVTSVQSVNPVSTLNLDRNDLNESLDSNFDLIDSIPEEEEGEEDV